MKQSLPPPLLEELSRQITQRMGILFPPNQWDVLERAFSRAAKDLGFANHEECARWFISAPHSRQRIETMASYLAIGETYFLREQQSFEILEREILPEIIRRRAPEAAKRLRIWSAGCASGEEAYCLAIVLHRMRELLRNWEISILATDINPQALNKARAAIYTDWSFRSAPNWFKQKYFTPLAKGRFQLIPAIRNMVYFSYFNLMEDPCPSLFTETNAMDLILCRNVLMYFPPNLARQAVERLRGCLVEGGWLLVSSCELPMPPFPGFSVVNYSHATFYRKQGCGQADLAARHSLSAFPPAMNRGAPAAAGTKAYSPAAALAATPAPAVPVRQPVVAEISPATPPPASSSSAAELCRIRANEGELDQALRLADEAINADKLNAGLHYLRAMILQEQGGASEAERSLRRALYLDQNLVLAHFSLGNLAFRQGKNTEARKHFNHALNLLNGYQPDEVLPESEGLLARRLSEIIRAMKIETRQGVCHE